MAQYRNRTQIANADPYTADALDDLQTQLNTAQQQLELAQANITKLILAVRALGGNV